MNPSQQPTPQSEVACLRQQIRQEYESAVRGLNGLARGTAQHAFITKRIENLAEMAKTGMDAETVSLLMDELTNIHQTTQRATNP